MRKLIFKSLYFCIMGNAYDTHTVCILMACISFQFAYNYSNMNNTIQSMMHAQSTHIIRSIYFTLL